ncbi:hypothetical protein [Streptomyces sp. NBC_01445]|uniref:hypothetical protein n=1 Tax=Streptomyces sp. NBC_01445 TaxID=2903869 RepID=UPI002DDB3DE6|nr:hypothetical protein [Streptomyces sp. NBC_01445]WSE02236.1 hypothetical protein OG574_01670 [Streptomyces sp. NBC_01445]
MPTQKAPVPVERLDDAGHGPQVGLQEEGVARVAEPPVVAQADLVVERRPPGEQAGVWLSCASSDAEAAGSPGHHRWVEWMWGAVEKRDGLQQ